MARLARLSIAGQLHLVIQRVHQGQAVFADAVDRGAYLACLREAAARHGVAIHAYGLQPGEVRLLATPADARSLGLMVQFIGRTFVAGFNRRHARRGALWDGRFRSTVVEPEAFFLACLRYVETHTDHRPHDESGRDAARDAAIPPWSSAEHHAGQRSDPAITEHAQFWSLGNTPFEREAACRAAQEQPLPAAEAQGIAFASLHGWALGTEAFVQSLGASAPRRVHPLSAGRPARSQSSNPA